MNEDPLWNMPSQERSVWASSIYATRQIIVSEQDKGINILFDLLYSCSYLMQIKICIPLYILDLKRKDPSWVSLHSNRTFGFAAHFCELPLQRCGLNWPWREGQEIVSRACSPKTCQARSKPHWSTNKLPFSFNWLSISDMINPHFI